MAKTYNIREMADAFNGKDYAAQADFGARYPLVAIKMAALFAKAPEEAYDFCMAMPEYLTGQKLNGAFKDAFLGAGEEGEDDEPTGTPVEENTEDTDKPQKPVKKEKPAPKVEKAEGGVEAMRGELIYKRLGELNLKKDFIEKMGTKKFSKPNMVEYINKYGINIGDDAEPMVYEEEDEKLVKPAKAEKPAKAAKAPKKEENEEDNDDLENKTPLQLYDICQKRGIKAKTRQTKEYYLGLLKEAEEVTGGPEDWDDTEDTEALEEAPKAKAKPAKKVAPKKEEPAEEAESDDDDDSWDI